MNLVIDTSAILSLSCSKHFDFVAREHKIVITKTVYEELKTFSRYDDFLGQKAKWLIKRKLKIENPKQNLNLGLDLAETEVFSLSQEKKLMAITDDIHASRVANEKIKIDSKPSFYLLLLLYKKNKITKEELIEDINNTLKFRNWLNGSIWEYALDIIRNKL